MARTIASGYAAGVTLTSSADIPLSITSTGSVGNTAGAGLSGAAALYWSVTNAGTISGAGGLAGADDGIAFSGGAAIANQTAALIAGYGFGVALGGSGTLVNHGTITATQSAGNGYHFTAPSGSAAATITVATAGVMLPGGGVSNAASGTIAGVFQGVALSGAGSVTNAGAISATGTSGIGIVLGAAAGVTNAAGGTIAGGNWGLLSVGAPVTLANAGAVSGQGRYGVFLYSGGTITNTGTGVITGAGIGALIEQGGSVGNAAGARITASGYGVVITAQTGTITNRGIIAGTATAASYAYSKASGNDVPAADSGALLTGGGAVTNLGGGVISGLMYGVKLLNGAGSVANFGTISGTDSKPAYIVQASSHTILGRLDAAGVIMSGGGAVYNAASATVSGLFYGVALANTAGTVTNLGTIISTETRAGASVQLSAGGVLTNGPQGTISGKWIGVQVGSGNAAATAASTIVNAGSISAVDSIGDGADLWLRGPSYVLNTGVINGGPFGIVLYDRSTVVNRGTIIGGSVSHEGAIVEGNTANATGTAALHLELAPQGTIGGYVTAPLSAAGTAANVLELLPGLSVGTVSGFGSKYQNFGSIVLDTGANWTLAGTVAATQTIAFPGAGGGAVLTLASPGAVSGTITGFGAHETLALAGITDVTGVSLSATGNVLSVTESAGPTLSLHFDPAQNFAGYHFTAVTSGAATEITAPCFAEGTAILTAAGLVPVEALQAGMCVVTHRGSSAEIVWIGHRRVACASHPVPQSVWPVRVMTGAFGPGRPQRDLWLSPDHAVFYEGVLIPVRYLINGRTIAQVPVAEITYYHVELSAHDVILAEGLAVESYLDTGNRAAFVNTPGVVMAHPDFARRVWTAQGCARLALAGAPVVRARHMLLLRAGALGCAMTDDPGLRVLAGGRTLPIRRSGRTCRVRMPRGASEIRIVSRAWVPAEMRPAEHDHRRLGIAVGHVRLDGQAIALADDRLAAGWHDPEPEWRWTDGNARLRLPGVRQVAFDVMMAGDYWQTEPIAA